MYFTAGLVTPLPSFLLGFDCAGHREGRTVDNVNGAIGSRPGNLPVSVHPSPSLPLVTKRKTWTVSPLWHAMNTAVLYSTVVAVQYYYYCS